MFRPTTFILLFGVSLCAETVKYVAVIYRHGDRTPVDTYPTDPWRNESLWPVKFGELTNTGKRQHFALGQWLRTRYSHLLSGYFEPTEIYVRSTDVDRTLMSAQANLAGMYPPTGNSIWDTDLLWQPIPVHTTPEKDDEILAMKRACPAYKREYNKYKNSKCYKKRLSKYQGLMEYVSANTGMKVKSYYDLLDIYTTLKIEQLYNFTLPNWTDAVFPDKMKDPACYSFTDNTGTPLLARLQVGPLLKQIVTKMFTVMYKADKLKMAMYSGHDLTIASILNALGMFDNQCPPYTATILMELVYDNSTASHSVRISYRNTTEIVEPQVLIIPHCGTSCPVNRFVKLYEDILSVNWEYECNKQFPQLLGVSFFVGLGLFVVIYVVHKAHFTRMARQNGYDLGYTTVQAIAVIPKTQENTQE